MLAYVGRPLCTADRAPTNGQFFMENVSGEELCSHVKHYLSYHMIKEFEVLNFLEESGDPTPPLKTFSLVSDFKSALSGDCHTSSTTIPYISICAAWLQGYMLRAHKSHAFIVWHVRCHGAGMTM